MIKTLRRIALTLSVWVVSVAAHADSAAESLSPELRALLSKEMYALQEGMQSILPAYTSGNLKEVVQIAEQMKNSYVLKQKITATQKQELMTKMPESFLHLDKEFHEMAGMLKHVAEEGHLELVGFYYYKLTESCVSCHRQYAAHKFSKFQKKPSKSDHHH